MAVFFRMVDSLVVMGLATMMRKGWKMGVLDKLRRVFDRKSWGFDRKSWGLDFSAWFAPGPASKQVAFTIAFVGLAAKMAKADGIAVEVEREAFETCFYVPPSERANIKRVYDLASRDVAGFEVYAERIAKLFVNEPALLRDVFGCLFHIAAADGVLHQGEEAFLREVAARFGFSDAQYHGVRNMFVVDPDSPYRVLGVEFDISDVLLKKRYRELVLEHHPDKLAGEGVPREFLVMADRKLAAINAAYEAIKKSREERSRDDAPLDHGGEGRRTEAEDRGMS